MASPLGRGGVDICRSDRAGQAASISARAPICSVTEIRYMGDEGGLVCHLDFGFSDTKNLHIVSITHHKFDRRNPLAREIGAYCKHRIKRLKKLHGRMASN